MPFAKLQAKDKQMFDIQAKDSLLREVIQGLYPDWLLVAQSHLNPQNNPNLGELICENVFVIGSQGKIPQQILHCDALIGGGQMNGIFWLTEAKATLFYPMGRYNSS